MGILVSAGVLTALAMAVLWVMLYLENKRVRSKIPEDAFEFVRSAKKLMAQAELRVIILSDAAQMVAEFSTAARSEEDTRRLVEDLLMSAVQGVLPGNHVPRIRLLLMNQQSGRLEPYVSFTPHGSPSFRGTTFQPGQGAVGQCYQSRAAIIVDDVDTSELFYGSSVTAPYKSVVCVPVPATGGQPIGVLNLDAPVKRYFNAEHIEFLAAISNLIFLAILSQQRGN